MYVDNGKLSYSPAELFILRERNNLSWNRNLYSTQISYLPYWTNIEQTFCVEINIYISKIFFQINKGFNENFCFSMTESLMLEMN